MIVPYRSCFLNRCLVSVACQSRTCLTHSSNGLIGLTDGFVAFRGSPMGRNVTSSIVSVLSSCFHPVTAFGISHSLFIVFPLQRALFFLVVVFSTSSFLFLMTSVVRLLSEQSNDRQGDLANSET